MLRPARDSAAAALVLALLPSGAAAATVDDLVQAMEIDPATASNAAATGELDHQLAVLPSLGGIVPGSGDTMAMLVTGDAQTVSDCQDVDAGPYGPDGDVASLEMDLVVPGGAASFTFDFYFMSREYPYFVGSAFNDSFTAELTSQAWTGNVAFDADGNEVNINNVFFVGVPEELQGSGFDCVGAGGGTRWIRNVAPVVEGETIHIKFTVSDVTDGIFDSAVLLDRFQFGPTAVSGPSISPVDGDEDGEIASDFGGTDCDDTDPDVNSAAIEECGDGTDNDCDRLTDHDDIDCVDAVGLASNVDGEKFGCSCDAASPRSPATGARAIPGLLLAALSARRRRPVG